MWVRSLGSKDPLEEGMATYCSILAWRIPWAEGSGGLQSVGLQRVRHHWSDLAHNRTSLFSALYAWYRECRLYGGRRHEPYHVMEKIYFGHPMWRADPLQKPWYWEKLRAGGEVGGKGWDGWMASSTQRHESEKTLGDSEGQGSLACCSPWSHKEQTWLSNWKTATRKKM